MSEQMNKAGDFTDCPNWGKGGRFVVDPTTGQRVPVVEEEPTPAASEESKADQVPAAKSTKR